MSLVLTVCGAAESTGLWLLAVMRKGDLCILLLPLFGVGTVRSTALPPPRKGWGLTLAFSSVFRRFLFPESWRSQGVGVGGRSFLPFRPRMTSVNLT